MTNAISEDKNVELTNATHTDLRLSSWEQWQIRFLSSSSWPIFRPSCL